MYDEQFFLNRVGPTFFDLYKQAERIFGDDPMSVVWPARVQADIDLGGMDPEASLAKHAAECKRGLGLNPKPPAPGTSPMRVGRTRLEWRTFADDLGPYFPLGTTLFWALGGMHRGEKDRVFQNIDFARREMHVDYVRILGQTSWTGEEIDPFWSEYPALLSEFIDRAYDLGIKTQLTAFAEGCADPLRAAHIMADVVAQRAQKVVLLEAKNEGKDDTLVAQTSAIARVFGTLGLPFGVGLGDQGIDVIEQRSNETGATVAFFHQERSTADDGARNVRQCWDMKEFRRAVCANEPPGPASSGASEDRPDRLAAMRAADIICGAGAWCFHTGSGVFGRPLSGSYGTRYANLWEIPDIREIAAAVRNADRHLPTDIGNWQKFNTNHPIKVKSGIVNKLYGARNGVSFVEIAIGCVGPTRFVADRACTLDIVDPTTGDVLVERSMRVGDEQESTLWAPILIGTES